MMFSFIDFSFTRKQLLLSTFEFLVLIFLFIEGLSSLLWFQAKDVSAYDFMNFPILNLDIQFFNLLHPISLYLMYFALLSSFFLLRRKVCTEKSFEMQPKSFLSFFPFIVLLGLLSWLYSNSNHLSGIDTPSYFNEANSLRFGTGHDICVNLLYVFKQLSFSDNTSLFLLISIIVLTVFFSGFYLFRNFLSFGESSFSALFLTLSFQTTVGFIAGIYEQWIVFGFILLFFAFFLKLVQEPKLKYLAMSILFSVLIFVTHVWSYAIVLSTVFVFLFISSITKRDLNRFVDYLFFFNVGFSSALYILFQPLIHQNIRDLLFFEFLENPTIYTGYTDLMKYFVYGVFAVPVVYLLSIIGNFTSIHSRNLFGANFRILTVSWIIPILGFIFFFLFNPWYLWRLVYLSPINLIMPIGALWISGKLQNKKLILFALTFILLSYTLRSLLFAQHVF